MEKGKPTGMMIAFETVKTQIIIEKYAFILQNECP